MTTNVPRLQPPKIHGAVADPRREGPSALGSGYGGAVRGAFPKPYGKINKPDQGAVQNGTNLNSSISAAVRSKVWVATAFSSRLETPMR
jgi:hypothetical protein